MRGCACRGDIAGFVHIECLTELAKSKEASGDLQVVYKGWNNCGNCKQNFQGALWLEMNRRFWRSYRASQGLDLRYNSTKNLAICLEFKVPPGTEASQSAAKLHTANPQLYAGGMHQLANVLLDLDRHQEAHEAASEAIAWAKAKFGMKDTITLRATTSYAIACAKLGRLEEAKATFEDVVTTHYPDPDLGP